MTSDKILPAVFNSLSSIGNGRDPPLSHEIQTPSTQTLITLNDVSKSIAKKTKGKCVCIQEFLVPGL